MQMPNRKFEQAASGYRYGFNGKERDKDINSLTAYDYGFRIYNPAIGKFLSVDPLTQSYPFYTPYQFASNSPIIAIGVDGLESSIILNNTEASKQILADKYGRTPEERTNPSLYFKNREREAVTAARQVAKGVLIAGAVALDVFVTKGWATRTVIGYEVISAFEHNSAPTPEGRVEQDRRSKEHLTNAILMWGGGKVLGVGFGTTAELATLARNRFNFAKTVYKKAGFSQEKFLDHAKGIDLTKKVDNFTYEKGTVLEQWSYLGKDGKPIQGNYYTLLGTDPNTLGVSLKDRVKTLVTLDQKTTFLQSTAGDIHKGGETLKGGGIQLFQTNVKASVTIPKTP